MIHLSLPTGSRRACVNRVVDKELFRVAKTQSLIAKIKGGMKKVTKRLSGTFQSLRKELVTWVPMAVGPVIVAPLTDQ